MFGLFALVWLVVLIGMMIFFWKLRNDEKLAKKLIKWQNDIQGVETKITPNTTKWFKISATLGLILGSILLLLFFSSFSFLFHFL